MPKLTNLAESVKDFNGQPIFDRTGKELSLLTVLLNSLGGFGGQGVSGEELIKAYDLGQTLFKAGKDAEVTAEQIAFIKKALLTNPQYTAIVLGQITKKLDEALTTK